MTRKKLDKLWNALEAAWRTPQTADDLEALARMCERRMRSGGNHPVWVTDHFPHRPLPIERHGGNPPVPPHVKKVILSGLEADAEAWEYEFERQKKNGSGEVK